MRQEGFEATHTLDLLLRNRTPDSIINELSVREQYIVVTKDEDFVSSFHLQRRPRKLLLVSTGNISNAELEALFLASLAEIEAAFQQFDFVEMVAAILHDKKKILPWAVYLNGEYGLKDLFVGVPALLGRKGMEKVIELDLSADEKAQLQKSADAVHELVTALPKF
ncbi:MAG TPA: DUF5615 family PIN-like protein [Thermoanaerobaculia bacterium]|nr:DUF5615 family PIN-like protein [Thermoanaerobaculia bacterium]